VLFTEVAAQGQEVMVINAAHSMPTTYHYHDGFLKMAEEVYERSNGRMQIKIFPAAQLGEEVSTVEQCSMGAIDIVLTGHVFNYVPKTAVFYLPFMLDDPDKADRVVNGPIGKKVFSEVESHNMKVISVWHNGIQQFTNNKWPINSVEDMVGLKMRAPEMRSYLQALQAFGATATPMPFAETITSIVQGMVDGQGNALLHIIANKTYEVQDYIAMANWMYGAAPLLVNLTWFDSLSDEDQQIIIDSAGIANTYMRAVAAEREKEAIDYLIEQGLQVTYPDVDSFKEKLVDLYEGEWADVYGADIIKAIQDTE
jgi:tripartite ATP-independent transporter DctP family solute receptor